MSPIDLRAEGAGTNPGRPGGTWVGTGRPGRTGETSVRRDDSAEPPNGFDRRSPALSIMRRLPVTTWILAPYLVILIPFAVINGNHGIWFLLRVVAIAVAGTFLVDLTLGGMGSRAKKRRGPGNFGRGLFYLAFVAILIGSAVTLAAAMAGKGSVAAQIGLTGGAAGPIGVLDSLFGVWVNAGIALLVAAYYYGVCTRAEVLIVTAVALVAHAAASYFTQITQSFFNLAIFVAMFFVLFGVIKIRHLLVSVVLVLVTWPTIFAVRNTMRLATGIVVDDSVSAFDRLRFDEQFARAQELPVPLEVNAPGFLQDPSVADYLRYGIIPRFMDPNRDVVSTGAIINLALGGDSTSTYTFGPVTTIYVLQGAMYLFLFYLVLALLVNLAWRGGNRLTPVRIMILAFLLSGPLGWFSILPDAAIGFGQAMVASIPLLVVLRLLRIHGDQKAQRAASLAASRI